MDPVSALGAGVAGAIGKRIASRIFSGLGAGEPKPPPIDRQQFDRLLKLAAESNKASGATSTAPSAAKAEESESSSGTGGVITAATTESALGKDAFLQLLVTQMQYQDPLDPVDNSQMIAQLAQFSALEQMQGLNASFETLSGNVDQLNFLSASDMLGKTVSGLTESGSFVEGEVEKVQLNGSLVYLTVDGELLSMARVLTIEGTPVEGAPVEEAVEEDPPPEVSVS
jgi:flagellar basal-body rod modification protein FlgD